MHSTSRLDLGSIHSTSRPELGSMHGTSRLDLGSVHGTAPAHSLSGSGAMPGQRHADGHGNDSDGCGVAPLPNYPSSPLKLPLSAEDVPADALAGMRSSDGGAGLMRPAMSERSSMPMEQVCGNIWLGWMKVQSGYIKICYRTWHNKSTLWEMAALSQGQFPLF